MAHFGIICHTLSLLSSSHWIPGAELHCKGLQGITGALQGNWVTGIPHLQGFVMCHFTCNY